MKDILDLLQNMYTMSDIPRQGAKEILTLRNQVKAYDIRLKLISYALSLPDDKIYTLEKIMDPTTKIEKELEDLPTDNSDFED